MAHICAFHTALNTMYQTLVSSHIIAPLWSYAELQVHTIISWRAHTKAASPMPVVSDQMLMLEPEVTETSTLELSAQPFLHCLKEVLRVYLSYRQIWAGR